MHMGPDYMHLLSVWTNVNTQYMIIICPFMYSEDFCQQTVP